MERLLKNPPVTRVMLEVLDHDDDIDIEPALVALGGLELTGFERYAKGRTERLSGPYLIERRPRHVFLLISAAQLNLGARGIFV